MGICIYTHTHTHNTHSHPLPPSIHLSLSLSQTHTHHLSQHNRQLQTTNWIFFFSRNIHPKYENTLVTLMSRLLHIISYHSRCLEKHLSSPCRAPQPTQYYTPQWAHILYISPADNFLMFRKCIMGVIAAVIHPSPPPPTPHTKSNTHIHPGKWYLPEIHSLFSCTGSWCRTCVQLSASDNSSVYERRVLMTYRQRGESQRELK